MDDDIGLLETELFLDALSRLQVCEVRGFAVATVHAKLQAFCKLNDFSSISALQGAALRDACLAGDICRYVSLHESTSLGSDLYFNALHYASMPMLRSSPWPTIWLAECMDSELVGRVLSMLEVEGLARRARVFVTHSNERLLAETMERVLTEGGGRPIAKGDIEAPGYHEEVHALERTSSETGLTSAQSSSTVWAQHDLGTDGSFNEFNVIVCCRPLNAFTPAVQNRALALFDDSLSNFGILQVEPTGEAHAKARHIFGAVLAEQGVYRKSPTRGVPWRRPIPDHT